jgi:cysteinyl-tRNA synthetase
MADQNTLDQVKAALQSISDFLDKAEVRAALGQIPDTIKKPVLDGLKTILNVIQKALDELNKNLGAVTTIHQLLDVINALLDAAQGLAQSEKDTLESVKSVVKTLQDLPDAAQIKAISDLAGGIITKIEHL